MRKLTCLVLTLLACGCAGNSIDDAAYSESSGLLWQRCAIGAQWDGAGCVGEAESLNWAASVDACSAMGPGYRLPSLRELGDLLGECSEGGVARCAPCAESAECSRIFSDRESYGWTWTLDPTDEGASALVVDLGDGAIAFDATHRDFHARCVSDR